MKGKEQREGQKWTTNRLNQALRRMGEKIRSYPVPSTDEIMEGVIARMTHDDPMHIGQVVEIGPHYIPEKPGNARRQPCVSAIGTVLNLEDAPNYEFRNPKFAGRARCSNCSLVQTVVQEREIGSQPARFGRILPVNERFVRWAQDPRGGESQRFTYEYKYDPVRRKSDPIIYKS